METKTEDTVPLAGIQKIQRANPEINHWKKINTGSKTAVNLLLVCYMWLGVSQDGGWAE